MAITLPPVRLVGHPNVTFCCEVEWVFRITLCAVCFFGVSQAKASFILNDFTVEESDTFDLNEAFHLCVTLSAATNHPKPEVEDEADQEPPFSLPVDMPPVNMSGEQISVVGRGAAGFSFASIDDNDASHANLITWLRSKSQAELTIPHLERIFRPPRSVW